MAVFRFQKGLVISRFCVLIFIIVIPTIVIQAIVEENEEVGQLVGGENVHDLICRMARRTGRTFERQTKEMVRKSQLAHSSAGTVISTDTTVCSNELGNGFLDEEKHSNNEFKFRQNAAKNMPRGSTPAQA